MEDKTIMITHATTRLGMATASHFLNLGSHVVLVDDNEKKLDQAIRTTSLISEKVYKLCLDFSSTDSIQSAFQVKLKQFTDEHPIDCLMNLWSDLRYPNLMHKESFDGPCNQVSQVIAKNLFLTRMIVQHMYSNKTNGVIININNTPEEDHSNLDSPPIMLQGFTMKWAQELKNYNIRVVGFVPSNFIKDDPFDKNYMNDDEVVRNIEYLLRNKYSSGITHELIH